MAYNVRGKKNKYQGRRYVGLLLATSCLANGGEYYFLLKRGNGVVIVVDFPRKCLLGDLSKIK